MISDNDGIRWSKDRHDRHVSDGEETRRIQREQIIRRRIKAMYSDWQKAVRSKKTVSRDALIESLKRLRSNIVKEAKDAPGLKEFVDYTVRMIDNKMLELSAMTALNKLTLHQADGSPLDIPVIAPFSTQEELMRVTRVKQETERKGFIGFVAEDGKLLALRSDSNSLIIDLVGTLDNNFGVTDLPSMEQFKKGMNHNESEGL